MELYCKIKIFENNLRKNSWHKCWTNWNEFLGNIIKYFFFGYFYKNKCNIRGFLVDMVASTQYLICSFLQKKSNKKRLSYKALQSKNICQLSTSIRSNFY